MEKKEKEHIKICGISIWRILAYFVVYSVAGFIIETIFGLLTKGVLESRKSFLYGPFCSIYGLGAVLMILPLQKYKKNNYTLFFAGFFIGSIIEYMVSLVGELIFHIKWWDYSDQMFNINGRICVLFSLFWGLLAIYLMSDINPRIDKFIDFVKSKIPANYMKTVIIFSILFLSFDLGITVYALQMFSVRIIHENNLNVSNKQLVDTLYEKIYVNDQKQKDFIYKFFDNEKMIKTFPNIKIEDVDGNILFFRDYVKDIKPYYYNFRTNSHLKLKYLENVE
ncbi:MAG: putative ABC transporter permease [Clostridiales bacterium]